MPKKKAEAKEMISIYDPSRQAFFEAPVEVAEAFIKSAKEAEKKLAELKKENE